MPRPYVGGITTRIQRVRQPNGDIYVYERKFEYVKALKKTVDRGKKLLGKIPAGSTTGEMVPTRKLNRKKPTKVQAELKKIGLSDLLEWVGRQSGVIKDLQESFPEETAKKIDTIARYWVANHAGRLSRMEHWQMLHKVPCETILDKANYHNLFEEIGYSEASIQSLFKSRADRCPKKSALALDSTTISTYSTNIKCARQGFNKDGDGLDTVKLVCLFSLDREEPIAFSRQPGNLSDIAGIQEAIKQFKGLDIKDLQLVTDRGYTSWDNVYKLLKSHTKFLTAISIDLKQIQEILEKNRSEINKMSNTCPWEYNIKGLSIRFEKTFQSKQTGIEDPRKHRLYLHLFMNRELINRDEKEFTARLFDLKGLVEDGYTDFSEAAKKRISKYLIVSKPTTEAKPVVVSFNEDRCREAQQNFGYFALLSNQAEPAFDALKKYRIREKVEEGFKTTKGALDGHRCRVWGDETLKGRQFCQFIGLIYHCFLMKKINEVKLRLPKEIEDPSMKAEDKLQRERLLKWLNSKSLQQILDCFDCVELTRWADSKGFRARSIVGDTKRDDLLLQMLGVPGYKVADTMVASKS